MKILNAEPLDYSPDARAILRSTGELVERPLDRAGLIDALPPYDVLIVRLATQVDREVIDAGRNLKAIVTATTGLDHIDVGYATRRGIAVLSLRGERAFLDTVPATAEHTWALLLALVRRIPWAFGSVLDGRWERDDFRGHDLWGRRLGILGLGRIGRIVARYALAFGMRVFAYDRSPEEETEGVTLRPSLPALLRTSEILTLHVPLDAQTEGLIGEVELGLLPPGALLVNTARDGVVDERALLRALGSGQLGGAALDVLSDERGLRSETRAALLDYARGHGNLLITPHIGGATTESMSRTEIFMAEKLKRHLASPVRA